MVSIFTRSLLVAGFAINLFAVARGQNAAAVYEKSKASIVRIEAGNATGTGFVFGDRRTIITNYHVVESGSEIKVEIGGKVLKPSRVRFLPKEDLASLEFAADLPVAPLPLASVESLKPGANIVVVGFPLGFLSHSVSNGIVSGIREINGVKSVQFTAPISPGSSGSPLMLDTGEVIGIVVATIEEGQNINIAIHPDNLLTLSKSTPVSLGDFLAGAESRPKSTSGFENAELTDAERKVSAVAQMVEICSIFSSIGDVLMLESLDYLDKPMSAIQAETKDIIKSLRSAVKAIDPDLKPAGLDKGEAGKAYAVALKQLEEYVSLMPGLVKQYRGKQESLEEFLTPVFEKKYELLSAVIAIRTSVESNTWFDEKLFDELLDPMSYYWISGPNLNGVVPDTADSKRLCPVLYSFTSYELDDDCQVLALRKSKKDKWVVVADWAEISTLLSTWKVGKVWVKFSGEKGPKEVEVDVVNPFEPGTRSTR